MNKKYNLLVPKILDINVMGIENFISYYINEYRKFGKYNCKDTYYDDLKSDTTGELHKLGRIGFEFEKKNHDEREYKKSLKKNCFNQKV